MENSLLMKIDASFALNFLIYIQNIFLNQSRKEGEVTFPYLPLRITLKISNQNIMNCGMKFHKE